MADDQEKTEEPTQKKIEDARKEGNVPKSQDTSGVITLFVAILAVLLLFPYMAKHMIILFQYYFSIIGTPLDKLYMMDIAIVTMREFLLIIMPLATAVAVAGVIAAMAKKKVDNSNLFTGNCCFCGKKTKKEREELDINTNMFGEEYDFIKCEQCEGNSLTIRMIINTITKNNISSRTMNDEEIMEL